MPSEEIPQKIPVSPQVEIIEYDLTPKKGTKREKKRFDDFTMDGIFSDSMLIDDVQNESSFKVRKRKAEKEQEKEFPFDPIKMDNLVADVVTPTYSSDYISSIAEELVEAVAQVEQPKYLEQRNQEIAQRCFNLRTCPDHTCSAYQAANPRCWFVAGERCGCRTHLGIPSCFECQVFLTATPDPISRMRETVFYTLGVIKQRTEKLKIKERDVAALKDRVEKIQAIKKQDMISGMDELYFEQQLVGELVKFSKKSDEFETERDKQLFDQHKVMTEQLGSAYLQLQALTTELERTNKDLEQKVDNRTEELRMSNVALREAVKKSQEADRLKTEFIANVSHELRTPLNSIIGFSKVLISGIDGEVNENQRTDLSAIYNSGRHLLEIINSILELSKIEAGKTDLNISVFNIEPLIDEIVTASQALVMGKRVKIESKILNKIPALEADATKIRQIIFNLVSNAAKFTEEGFITITVSAKDQNLILSVTDSGIGIDKAHMAAIFERFRQVDGSSTRKAGGTGLGLAIAKRFIELLNGDIKVDSKLGKGSHFIVTLPLRYRPAVA